MAFLVGGANSLADTGYNIDNSLRINRGDSPALSDSITSTATSWTVSCWIKNTISANTRYIWSFGTGGNGTGNSFDSSSGLAYYDNEGAEVLIRDTNPKFRDPSAWYHFVCKNDGGTITTYMNGVQQATGTGGQPLLSSTLYVGRFAGTAYHWDGYISEFYFIDGTAYSPSTFAETDEGSGIWKPKEADVTFGSDGLFLEFKQTGTGTDSSGMGADTSGNDNHMAVSNLAATDVTTDTPTNNFCTINILTCGTVLTQTPTLAEGNCQFTSTSSSSQGTSADGTIVPSSGKWYWEVKCTTTIRNGMSTGIVKVEGYDPSWQGDSYFYGADSSIGSKGYGYNYNTGKPQTNAVDSTTNQGSAVSTNDIVGVALDLDNGALYYSINGTFQASSDPTSGGSKTNAQHSFTAGDNYAPAIYGYQTTTFQVNYGNPPYANSSDAADAAGYGAFEYAPPSGYYALCTKNLAEFG